MNEALEQIKNLVAAAKGGNQLAQQLIAQITQAAKNGDQQAQQIVKVIQQLMTQKAEKGAKLEYIKRLNGTCPEGYEMKKYAVGGRVMSKCMKCGGKPVGKANGGPVEQYKEARAKQKREGKKVMQPQPSPQPKPAKKSK